MVRREFPVPSRPTRSYWPATPTYVDPFGRYDRFAADREDVVDVFGYVLQEPFASVTDASDPLVDARDEWNERDAAQ